MAKSAKRRIYTEHLNPNFGYFYDIGKTLYRGKTKFQKIEMVETPEFGTTLLLDGITQVVEKNEYQYHEPMVHPAMCSHPNPREVLIIGGGDGGILREVLKYPSVRHVDFAELDEEVIAFSRRYLKKINRNSFEDPRVSIHITDGRKFVESVSGRYDVIIMDMTDPFGPSRFLYTREFFKAVRRSMRTGSGIFVMHTESPISRPEVFNSIVKTLRSVFRCVVSLYTYIQMYAVLWSIGVSSDSRTISTIKQADVDRRLKKYGIKGLRLFNGSTFSAMRVSYPYVDDILKKRCRLITDDNPDLKIF